MRDARSGSPIPPSTFAKDWRNGGPMIQVRSAAGGGLRPSAARARRKQPTMPLAGSVSVPSRSTRRTSRAPCSVIAVLPGLSAARGYGVSHDPPRAERNSASMTRMLAMASSIGNSSGVLPEHGARKRVALQRVLVADRRIPRPAMPPPTGSAPLSTRIFVGRSGGALKGICDLDPALFADDRHALMPRQLRRAR